MGICGRQCRCILPLSQTDLEGCLRRLARVLYEQANQFYLDDSRRILAAHAEQRTPPPELNCRICFKVPVAHSLPSLLQSVSG